MRTERRVIRRATTAVGALLLSAALGGCTWNAWPYVTDGRLDEGLVVILPGLEGPSVLNASMRDGLIEGKLPYAVEINNWLGLGLGVAYAYDQAACRRQARRVAERIGRYRAEHPDRPVFLIGHSGGAAIAVFVAEQIPPDRPLTGVILTATPLHPFYDLTAALERCDGRMVNFYTLTDLWLVGLTMAFRNMDGTAGWTAGHTGFGLPEGAEAAALGGVSQPRRQWYSRLAQVPWDLKMAEEGNLGGHLGWSNAEWVAHDVTGIIRAWADGKSNEQIFPATQRRTAGTGPEQP